MKPYSMRLQLTPTLNFPKSFIAFSKKTLMGADFAFSDWLYHVTSRGNNFY